MNLCHYCHQIVFSLPTHGKLFGLYVHVALLHAIECWALQKDDTCFLERNEHSTGSILELKGSIQQVQKGHLTLVTQFDMFMERWPSG